MSLEQYYQKFLDENPYPRKLKNFGFTSSPVHVTHQGRLLINFSGNDYLGLAQHPLLIERCGEYSRKWGVGAASSRMVTGNLPPFAVLEKQIAAALGKPAALIFGAGYQTNISVLEALLDVNVLGEKPLVFCDRLAHVSMLSMTQHNASLIRFRHNDLDHLQKLLEIKSHSSQPKFILVESIYSMDGDSAPLAEIISLAKTHNAFLYVDDAHAVGVYGKNGWGKAVEYARDIDVVMGTFSKGLGSFGGYIACSEMLRDYLTNKCRGFIYSTGTSPAVLGAIAGAIELLPTLENERKKLHANATRLRQFFQAQGLDCGHSNTHIIPWITGDAEKTLQLSKRLEQHGILAATIRPPSVSAGKCRIRFCLSSAHQDEDITALIEAIGSLISSPSLLLSPA
jgi:8-amino-7-oxononanoate synthase